MTFGQISPTRILKEQGYEAIPIRKIFSPNNSKVDVSLILQGQASLINVCLAGMEDIINY